jgi:glycosyltransferase involved in cell wall biosynthesis
MTKKRIIICSNVYPPHFIGGAELIAHYQAKKMKEMGHEVIIFAGDSEIQGKRYDLHQDSYEGLSVYKVRLQSQDYNPNFINFYHRPVIQHFSRLIDDFSPHVVHFHHIIGLSVGLIHLAKRKGIKTVLTLHDHWGFCFKNTLIKDQEQICRDYGPCEDCLPFIREEDGMGIPISMRKDFLAIQLKEVDTFISPSQYLAEAYVRAGIPREKIRAMWNGIDVNRFSHLSKSSMGDTLRFTCIGYLGKHKGIHIILNALPLIDHKHRIRINLVGAGDLVDSYKKQVEQIGWDNSVKFWGKIDNSRIEEVYRETDVLLLASVTPENQPVSIVEAMAAGTPVIASRIGGIPELVEDGKTGYLFEAGNAKDLADKMLEFVLHPERLKTFGENAYGKIKGNTFENQVSKILQVYDEKVFSLEEQQGGKKLIVCVGKCVDNECSQAMSFFRKKREEERSRFVMGDWLEKDQIREAKMLWVVDGKAKLEDVSVGMQYGIPLLVPEGNRALKSLCSSANCGLYYHDGIEAEVCLEYLLQNQETASAMGQNGYRMLQEMDQACD